ncbi:aminoacyltransferase, partial [Patescibacteria group bacterium]|nr:aminoacyltransferase [Patescibacteria group bacterium]
NKSDDFGLAQSPSQLLQSFAWGEFQQQLGHQVWRIGIIENENLIATAQIIEHCLPLGKSYLYCPRGPVINAQNLANNEQIIKLFLKKTRDITIQTSTKEEMFFRFEPTFDFVLTDSHLSPTKDIQPSQTLIINLTQTEEILSKNLHHKTRYNIKLAEKKGIIIKEGSLSDFTKVWPLFEQTAKRDRFRLHSKNYYQQMLKVVPHLKIWLALYEKKIIATLMAGYFGDTATYLHGASSYKHRSLMAPLLLQWQVIKNTKTSGYHYYDLHGIAPTRDPHHPWAGITRFKKGFGGQEFSYPGTFDFIFQPFWYKMYKIFRKVNLLFKY